MISLAQLRRILSYDAETGTFVWVCPPDNHPRLIGVAAGTVGPDGYVAIKIDGRKYKAHRLAWLYVHGELPKSRIDHRDGNQFNNSIENLRLATQSQNCANCARKRGKKLPKGVRYMRNKYQARIGAGHKLIHLGTYHTVHAAAAAYETAARRIYGEFARPA